MIAEFWAGVVILALVTIVVAWRHWSRRRCGRRVPRVAFEFDPPRPKE